MRTARDLLVSLSVAEHAGDVNNDLEDLAVLLNEPSPEWSDEYERFVFPWEDSDD